MTVHTLAADVGVDPDDISVIARWLTVDEVLDDAALEGELCAVVDSVGRRTARGRSACGRWPGPNLVLVGWHPCLCGGHATTYCRADNGGCVGAGTPGMSRRSPRSGAATRGSGSAGSGQAMK